jgi:hypothetical protein
MAHIVLLALAAAVFPTLIACVAIMISRPEPRRLLVAFYAGGLLVSVFAGIVVLNAFKRGDSFVGNSSSSPNPGTSIVTGVLALVLGRLMASGRERALLARWRSRHPRRRERTNDGPSWAERHLDRANATVALAVGAAINLPGPFYLIALGDLATMSYSTAEQLLGILLFNSIMFLLVEIPLVGYLLRPAATTRLVGRLSAWLNANGLRLIGWLAAAFGVGLIAQGIAAAG